MSVDSALIVRRERLPDVPALAALVADTGVECCFQSDFDLTRTAPGWVRVTVDGEDTGFEYGVSDLGDLDAEEAPAHLKRYGDTLLSFTARGTLSAQVVSLIQTVLARHCEAAGWIEDEVIPPGEMVWEGKPDVEMDPDLAATLTGTPAERAAAVDRYVAKFYPPLPQDPYARVKNVLKQVLVPILIFAALGGFYLWSQLK